MNKIKVKKDKNGKTWYESAEISYTRTLRITETLAVIDAVGLGKDKYEIILNNLEQAINENKIVDAGGYITMLKAYKDVTPISAYIDIAKYFYYIDDETQELNSKDLDYKVKYLKENEEECSFFLQRLEQTLLTSYHQQVKDTQGFLTQTEQTLQTLEQSSILKTK